MGEPYKKYGLDARRNPQTGEAVARVRGAWVPFTTPEEQAAARRDYATPDYRALLGSSYELRRNPGTGEVVAKDGQSWRPAAEVLLERDLPRGVKSGERAVLTSDGWRALPTNDDERGFGDRVATQIPYSGAGLDGYAWTFDGRRWISTGTKNGTDTDRLRADWQGSLGPARRPVNAMAGAVQGFTANFADEIAGGSRRLTGRQGAYQNASADALFEGGWKRDPVSYGTGYAVGSAVGLPVRAYNAASQGVGALMRGGAEAAEQVAPRLGQKFTQMVAGGALSGATDMAGRSRSETLTGRGRDAAIGGAVGAVATPAFAGAAAGLGNLGRTVASRIPGMQNFVVSGNEAQLANELAQAFTTNANNVAGDAAQRSAARGARYLATPRAMMALVRKLREDGVSGDGFEAISRLARASNADEGITTASGKGSIGANAIRAGEARGLRPETLLDLAEREGWENTSSFIRGAAGIAGPARTAARQEAKRRAAQGADDLRGIVDDLDPSAVRRADGTRHDLEITLEALRDARGVTAQAGYGMLDDVPVQVSDTPLASLQRNRTMQRALKRMYDAADPENTDLPIEEALALRRAIGLRNGRYEIGDGASARLWDRVKREVDSDIFGDQKNLAGTAMREAERRGARSTQERLLDALDEATTVNVQGRPVSIYSTVRNNFAEDSAAINAAEFADSIWSPGDMSSSEWIRRVGGMTAEQVGRARGVAMARLQEQFDQNASAAAGKLQRDVGLQNRVRALFGQDAADRLVARTARAANRRAAGNQLDMRAGSPTQRNQQAVHELSGGAAEATASLATMNPLTAIPYLLRKLAMGAQFTPRERAAVIEFVIDPITEQQTRELLMRVLAFERQRLSAQVNPVPAIQAVQAAQAAGTGE